MVDTVNPNPASEPSHGTSAVARGERRVVTVLFADVVNSTGLAEDLDPEDWTDIMNGAFPLLTAPIHRYEGTIGRLMGDGLLAFFRAPTSHEDDPERAVRAALDMVAAIKSYGETIRLKQGFDFEVRVGINTGFVVVADVGSAEFSEFTAMGDAVNVAARMQSTADPGTIQITGDTYRQVGARFNVEPLGDIELKGKSERVTAYRVLGPASDIIAAHGSAQVSAPLIGRDRELGGLKAAVDQVRGGRGQIVCLIGEAGLGKSRLISELRDYWLEREPAFYWDQITAVPYDAARPFGIFQNFAREMFAVELDDDSETIHRKIRDAFLSRGVPEEQFAMCQVAMERVIAAKVLHESKEYSGDEIKNDIYENMYPAFRNSSGGAPSVIVLDDMQWADRASVDLLIYLLRLTDEIPILFVVSFRPERQSPAWQVKLAAETDYPHRYEEIVLKPLDAAGSKELIAALLDIERMPSGLRETILRKTEGNPYFVEEVVRSLLDQGLIGEVGGKLEWQGGVDLSEITIPDSLQALLMARMDRLDRETRATLQMASVIGRQFYYSILLAISEGAMTIDKHLRSLERVELLREAGRKPELEYVFKHELARDAAYATILNRRRREFHLRVAQAMETIFADRLDEHAHRLARHFELAGSDERAARYYEMAGDVAAALGASADGGDQYARALAAARRFGAPDAQITRLGVKHREPAAAS
jgi:class 3 adenylate cyclase